MSAQFTAEEIIEITGGRLAQGMLPDDAGIICTDSRQIEDGNWYLALTGERFDGHDFIGDAFARGAIGCIVSERPSYAIGSTSFPLLAVNDTLEAYHQLARNWRRRINPVVVGITGSSGKTTTKEMCAAVFSTGFITHKSVANENNEFGVPKTILAMPDDTQILVVEMAMRGMGQIELLARTAEPDLAIIINIGVAHLELTGSMQNTAKAKCEILQYVKPDRGVAIIGQDNDVLLAQVKKVFVGKTFVFATDSVCEKESTGELTKFTAKTSEDFGKLKPLRPRNRALTTVSKSESHERLLRDMGSAAGKSLDEMIFSIKAHGLSHLQDAWCAITAGRVVGLDDYTIVVGLNNFQPIEGRGNKLKTKNGAIIIDESYNGNPDSVRAAVEAFLSAQADLSSAKYVVLGNLAELGPESPALHRELGKWLLDKKITALITVGDLARNIAEGAQSASFEVMACRDLDEVEKVLRPRLSADSSVLIKGSHSANLDKLVSCLVT